MFTNKHVVIAFLVAPILAVMAYMAVDMAMSEKPTAAQAGNSYKLAIKPNCQHESGACKMFNGDVQVELTWIAEKQSLQAVANLPLQGIKIAFGDPNQNLPIDFISTSEDGLNWLLSISSLPRPDESLNIVMSLNDSFYFGEATAVFFHYDTQFESKL